MATPPILDIESLSTPVSDEQPAGPELRSAPERGARNLFLSVRDLRKKAIDAERRVRNFELMTEEERKGNREHPIRLIGNPFGARRLRRSPNPKICGLPPG